MEELSCIYFGLRPGLILGPWPTPPKMAAGTGPGCASACSRAGRTRCWITSWSNICSRSPSRAATPSRSPRNCSREFGGFGALMTADAEAIARVGEHQRKRGRGAEDRPGRRAPPARGEGRGRPVLASWQALLDYLRADMAHIADRAGARAVPQLAQHADRRRIDVGGLGRRIGGLCPRSHAPRAGPARHRDHRRPQPSLAATPRRASRTSASPATSPRPAGSWSRCTTMSSSARRARSLRSEGLI